MKDFYIITVMTAVISAKQFPKNRFYNTWSLKRPPARVKIIFFIQRLKIIIVFLQNSLPDRLE